MSEVTDKVDPNFLNETTTVAPPKKVDNRKMFEKKRYKLILFAGCLFFLIGILGLIGIIAISVLRGQSSDSKITIEDVEEEVAEELTKQIIYGGTDSVGTEYYSPSLDLIFTYSNSLFSVSEATNYVNIDPKGVYTLYGELSTLENVKDAKKYYEDKLSDLYDDLEFVKEEDLGDGVMLYQFKYTQDAYYSEDDAKQDVYRTFIVKEIESTFVVIEARENGGSNVTATWTERFKTLIQTVDLNPENVATEIAVYVQDANMKVVFDRSKWNVGTQDSNSLSLRFRTSEYETNDDLKYSSTSLYMYSSSFYSSDKAEADEAYLKADLSDSIDSSRKIYSDNNFKIIEKEKEVDIGGLTFYYTKYSYKLVTSVVVETEYVGYNPATNSVISISTAQPQGTSVGGTELGVLIEAIVFNEGTTVSRAAKVLGTNSLEIDKAAIFGKPAVVQIFSTQCADISIQSGAGFQYIGGNTYSLCTAGSGTGFYVNKDGYIATNAHVAAGNPLDNVVTATQLGISLQVSGNNSIPIDPDGLGNDLLREMIAYYQEKDPTLNLNDPAVQEQVTQEALFLLVILTVDEQYDGIAEISNVTYENYIQRETPFEYDVATLGPKNASSIYETELVDYNEITSSYGAFYEQQQGKDVGRDVADLALLKIINPDIDEYPALRLSDIETVREGEEIYAIGFPGRADDQDTFSKEASLIPTITNGTISAIKPNHNNTFELIQIDASVAHGNSGGPIINGNGEVVGVVALLLFGSDDPSDLTADFNAGISVEELQTLMSDNSISEDVGQITDVLETGLDYFGNEYYEWAIDEFKKAKDLYPPLADVLDPLIKIASNKIDAGEDNTPVFTVGDINIHQNEAIIAVVIVACLALGFIMLVFLFLVSMLFRRGGKKSPPSQQPPYAQQPAQPMSSVHPEDYRPEPEVSAPVEPVINQPTQYANPSVEPQPLADSQYTPPAEVQLTQQPEPMTEASFEPAPVQPVTEPTVSDLAQPIDPGVHQPVSDPSGIHRPEAPFGGQ